MKRNCDNNYYITLTSTYPDPDDTDTSYLQMLSKKKWDYAASFETASLMSYWDCIKVLCEFLKHGRRENCVALSTKMSIHRVGYPENIAIRSVEVRS